MRPFRNAGWHYLETFESIIPVSGTKGLHVFVPTLATAPLTKFDEDEEVELKSTGRGTSSAGEGSSTIVDHGTNMNVDIGKDHTIAFLKWKASSDNDVDSHASGSFGPSNTAFSATSALPVSKEAARKASSSAFDTSLGAVIDELRTI